RLRPGHDSSNACAQTHVAFRDARRHRMDADADGAAGPAVQRTLLQTVRARSQDLVASEIDPRASAGRRFGFDAIRTVRRIEARANRSEGHTPGALDHRRRAQSGDLQWCDAWQTVHLRAVRLTRAAVALVHTRRSAG